MQNKPTRSCQHALDYWIRSINVYKRLWSIEHFFIFYPVSYVFGGHLLDWIGYSSFVTECIPALYGSLNKEEEIITSEFNMEEIGKRLSASASAELNLDDLGQVAGGYSDSEAIQHFANYLGTH